MTFIGCDVHKKYSVFVALDELGRPGPAIRKEHGDRAEFRRYLGSLPPGCPIAVEATGNWYWVIDEMERAGHLPLLTNPTKAKLMMGRINKTDKLDARGLAVLLRNGTLPIVWVPSRELRDQREILRTRMTLVVMSTRLKNRIHATVAKYGLQVSGVSDMFGAKGRKLLRECLDRLPPETRQSADQELQLLDEVKAQIRRVESRIAEKIRATPEMRLLMTLPGVGQILAAVLTWEIGSVRRFASSAHLASYAGTVPRVKSSGGKTYLGPVRPDVNRYLKWALVEAANLIVVHQKRLAARHVVRLYQRLRQRKGHGKAAVAVARHLAEAAFWILQKQEGYREPALVHAPVSAKPA